MRAAAIDCVDLAREDTPAGPVNHADPRRAPRPGSRRTARGLTASPEIRLSSSPPGPRWYAAPGVREAERRVEIECADMNEMVVLAQAEARRTRGADARPFETLPVQVVGEEHANLHVAISAKTDGFVA